MNAFEQANNEAGLRRKEINGKLYCIQLLPASKGLTIGKRLIKSLGTALGVVLDSNDNPFAAETIFTDLSIAIVSKIDDLDLEATIKELLGYCSCGGNQIDFDRHFAGNYGEMVAVVEFALRENFGDFFTDYLKAKGLEIHTLREMMNKKAETPEKSESE